MKQCTLQQFAQKSFSRTFFCVDRMRSVASTATEDAGGAGSATPATGAEPKKPTVVRAAPVEEDFTQLEI